MFLCDPVRATLPPQQNWLTQLTQSKETVFRPKLCDVGCHVTKEHDSWTVQVCFRQAQSFWYSEKLILASTNLFDFVHFLFQSRKKILKF